MEFGNNSPLERFSTICSLWDQSSTTTYKLLLPDALKDKFYFPNSHNFAFLQKKAAGDKARENKRIECLCKREKESYAPGLRGFRHIQVTVNSRIERLEK